MLNAKVIHDSSIELREFLELSCLYLSAADQQFTISEQDWIDTYFGRGTADRFLASFSSIQWDQVFSRINELAGHIPPHEMQLVSEGIEDFLKQLLSVDGFDAEEEVRLRDFFKFLTDIGIQIKQASPELPSPSPVPTKEQPVKKKAVSDNDPLMLTIDEINAKLNEPVPPVIMDSNSSVQLKRIDEYPEIRTYYEQTDSRYGPYVFEKAAAYDWEGKNPIMQFEGETVWHSIDTIKAVWANCYASAKQVERLIKEKVEFKEGKVTYKQACWALEKIRANKRAINAVKPAIKHTLKKMDELGVKYPEGITREQADRLINNHWEKVAKAAFKSNLVRAKEQGIDVDSKIEPFVLSDMLDGGSAPTQEQKIQLQHFNSILTKYGTKPHNFRNKDNSEAGYLLEILKEAIEWATNHSDVDGNYSIDSDTHYYHQIRRLNTEEIEVLKRECMKKIGKMVKYEEYYDEEERDRSLLKVAKSAFEKTKNDSDDW